MFRRITVGIVSASVAFGAFVLVAQANHAWSKYHWDISTEESLSSPLELGNNLSTAWTTSLTGAATAWNVTVLKNQVAAGASNASCDPTSGRVEACNAEYGNVGWLGIAQIWVTRGRSGHIVQGLVKVNDTYFNTPKYDTQSWRDYVMGQEVGHTFGLGHQNENFYDLNLGTYMDYTNDPTRDDGAGDNLGLNQHDEDMMAQIYAHLNSTGDSDPGPGKGNGKGNGKAKKGGPNFDLNDPSAWGQSIRQDARGNGSLFVRDLGSEGQLYTFVIWAE